MRKAVISGLIATILGGISVEIFRQNYLIPSSVKTITESSYVEISLNSPEELANEIIFALQQDDWKHFQYILPKENDFIELKELLSSDKLSKFESETNSFKNEFMYHDGTYNRMKKFGYDNNIKWNLIKNIRVETVIAKDKTYDLTFANRIFVYFSHDKKQYKFVIDDCIKSKRGWVFFDGIKLIQG